jgi:hypothetical protein
VAQWEARRPVALSRRDGVKAPSQDLADLSPQELRERIELRKRQLTAIYGEQAWSKNPKSEVPTQPQDLRGSDIQKSETITHAQPQNPKPEILNQQGNAHGPEAARAPEAQTSEIRNPKPETVAPFDATNRERLPGITCGDVFDKRFEIAFQKNR